MASAYRGTSVLLAHALLRRKQVHHHRGDFGTQIAPATLHVPKP